MDDDIDDGWAQDGAQADRAAQVRGALLKALGVVVAFAVIIGLGTIAAVRVLGLDNSDPSAAVGSGGSGPDPALPTTALPAPRGGGDTTLEASPEPSPRSSPTASTSPSSTGKIQLDVAPVRAQPNERVNLTGRYPGADDVELQVQRFQDGSWQDFGVGVPVRFGTYATYIQTGRSGEQRFRVYDPAAKQGSNVVLVTIG